MSAELSVRTVNFSFLCTVFVLVSVLANGNSTVCRWRAHSVVCESSRPTRVAAVFRQLSSARRRTEEHHRTRLRLCRAATLLVGRCHRENQHVRRFTALLSASQWCCTSGYFDVDSVHTYRTRILGTTAVLNLTNFSVHASCGRGSVLLWWHCNTLWM